MKFLSLFVSAVFAFNSLAMAQATKSVNADEVMNRYKNVSTMSKEEILNGLTELSGALALIKNDLAAAKETQDRRAVAVKVRNISLKVDGAALAVFLITRYGFYHPDRGAMSGVGAGLILAGTALTIIGSTLTAAGSEGYLILNKDEVAALTGKIANIENSIKTIQQKL